MLTPAAVCKADWNLYSGVASTSAGIELLHNVVVLMGNSRSAGGDLTVGHAVMRDALDLASVLAAFRNVGIDDPAGLSATARARAERGQRIRQGRVRA